MGRYCTSIINMMSDEPAKWYMHLMFIDHLHSTTNGRYLLGVVDHCEGKEVTRLMRYESRMTLDVILKS